MACVESAYVRRRLTYFSMTKCVVHRAPWAGFFLFPFGHLYRKRQTKPETELGSIAVVLGGGPTLGRSQKHLLSRTRDSGGRKGAASVYR